MANKHSKTGQQCVAKFKVHYRQILDHKGRLVGELPPFAQEKKQLQQLYRTMVLTRTFDTKCIALQRTGKMGTYASVLGQEAIGTAIGSAMKTDDVLCPAYREYAAQLQRGVTMREIMLYWGGDERGMAYENQPFDLPICVPIATQIPHAAGVATAFKLRKQPRVAVTVLGDGATSKGDFYEAMNLAGAWNLPMVIIATNNQWAISVPREAQTHAQTLAQKGIAAEIHNEQVDGNDVVAIKLAIEAALDRARSGQGPSLIEALTYRMSDHTTADDASRYRPAEELEKNKKRDPIDRLRKYLTDTHGWRKKDEETLLAECAEEVEAASQAYLDTPPLPPESMFEHLYAELPEAIEEQRQELLARIREQQGDHDE